MTSAPDLNSSGFWARHGQLLTAVIAIASAVMAVGPDSWMEWVLWGTTVVSHPTARIVLLIVAIVLAAAVALPLIRRSRRGP